MAASSALKSAAERRGPASSTSTSKPASASRAAAGAPPAPDPTTTASARSTEPAAAVTRGRSRRSGPAARRESRRPTPWRSPRAASERVAPTITLATLGWRRHQASASWASADPELARDRLQPVDARERLGREVGAHELVALRIGRAAAGGLRAARILAREHALRERATRRSARAPRARRSGAPPPRSAGAAASTAAGSRPGGRRPRAVGDAAGLADLRGAPLRDAPVEDLSLADQVLVGADRLLDRRRRVGAMALVQVEVVGAEAAQRGLDALEEVLAREAAVVRMLRHRKEGLGRDHEVAARDRRAAPAPSDLFGLARGVDVGGVEEVDAEVVGAVHDLPRRLAVDARAEREPGAERDLADLEPAAPERPVFHGAAFYRGGYPERARRLPCSLRCSRSPPPPIPPGPRARSRAWTSCWSITRTARRRPPARRCSCCSAIPQHAVLLAPLSKLAREELVHFEQVLALLAERGLAFGRHRAEPVRGTAARARAHAASPSACSTRCCAAR